MIGRREALDLKFIHNASSARESCTYIHIVMEVIDGRSHINLHLESASRGAAVYILLICIIGSLARVTLDQPAIGVRRAQ
jgi:hypothetical protein